MDSNQMSWAEDQAPISSYETHTIFLKISHYPKPYKARNPQPSSIQHKKPSE